MEEVRPDITCLEYKCDEEPPSRNETCVSASGLDGERPMLNGMLLSGPFRPDGSFFNVTAQEEARPRRRRAVQPVWAELDEERKYSWLCAAQTFMLNSGGDDDISGTLDQARTLAQGELTDEEKIWIEEGLQKLKKAGFGGYRGGISVPDVAPLFYFFQQFPESRNVLTGQGAQLRC